MSPKYPHRHTTSSPVPRLNVLSSLPGAILLLPCALLGAAQGTAGGCGCMKTSGTWASHVDVQPGWPLSPRTDRAKLYLPVLVISVLLLAIKILVGSGYLSKTT